MTPPAPSAPWRKVTEDTFSRLSADLDQQIESEVESRVSAAVDAVVRAAVSGAASESRTTLAEELNQSLRRLRDTASASDLYEVLADITAPFCQHAVVFSVTGGHLRGERMRRTAALEPGEVSTPRNLPALEFPASAASAFLSVIETRDPVIASATASQISAQLAALVAPAPDEKLCLVPLIAGGKVTAVLCAAGNAQAPALELLAGAAGLHLQNLLTGALHAESEWSLLTTAAGAGMSSQPAPAASLVNIAPPPPKPGEKSAYSGATSGQHQEWKGLTKDQKQMHLAAQRSARVKVAQMRLEQPDAVRSGRSAHDVYRALQGPLDRAREEFRERFVDASPTMVDYLHMELLRSLADDDPNMLGPGYPGPLV